MFDFTKTVTDLFKAQTLKQLGFPQGDGGFYYIIPDGKTYCLIYEEKYIPAWNDTKAATCGELLEFLPAEIETKGRVYRLGMCKEVVEGGSCPYEYFLWYDAVDKDGSRITLWEWFDSSFVNLLACALIWLKEHGYISFKEV